MSKLLKFKEWLNLEEAGRYLTALCGEPIDEADILRLALDGHLILSVRFVNHASARVGPVVPIEEAKYQVVDPLILPGLNPPAGSSMVLFDGLQLDRKRVAELSKEVISINEVWDLSMLGADRLDVERRYQLLTRGPAVELISLEGTIVYRNELFAQIQEHFEDNEYNDPKNLVLPRNHPSNWYPAGALPHGSVFVLKTQALEDLRRRLTESDPDECSDQSAAKKGGPVSGGRPMSALWPSWVAELATLLHEEGVPAGAGSKGADELIAKVSDRLAEQGLEGPSRSTVQDTARAVLSRLRKAGN